MYNLFIVCLSESKCLYGYITVFVRVTINPALFHST